jgi:hypothetical protein
LYKNAIRALVRALRIHHISVIDIQFNAKKSAPPQANTAKLTGTFRRVRRTILLVQIKNGPDSEIDGDDCILK